jgi:pimeloyl-ACP methyl ester carboxylesterase
MPKCELFPDRRPHDKSVISAQIESGKGRFLPVPPFPYSGKLETHLNNQRSKKTFMCSLMLKLPVLKSSRSPQALRRSVPIQALIATVLCGVAQQVLSTTVGEPVPLKESFSLTVRGDYVAGGVGFRNQDSGIISLEIPERAEIVKAFLYWSVIEENESPELTLATLNSKSIEGNLIGSTQSCTSNAEDQRTIFNFRADVTGIAAVGVNTVSFPPSSSSTLRRRGATLIAIFRDTNAGYREVVIYDGALSFFGANQFIELEFSRALNGIQPQEKTITTTWVVADGQPTIIENPGGIPPQGWRLNNVISVNDVEITQHALQGSAPGGPFWDTRTDDIGDIVLSRDQPRLGPTKAKFSIESLPGTPIPNKSPPCQLCVPPADCITWVAQVLSVSTKAPPVIVIPGVGGSVLLAPFELDPGNNGWPLDVLKTLIGEPEHIQFVEAERPRKDNISILLTPQCCVLQGFPPSPVNLLGKVPKLISFLDKEYKAEDQVVSAFPHDFRYSVTHNAFKRIELSDLNPNDPRLRGYVSPSLHNKVQEAIVQTGSRKVDLVAHSRGGLVAKEYLNEHPKNVRTLIMLATPNLGAPKALKILRYGDDLDETILGGLVKPVDACKLKRAAHNLPGVFNMLPGQRYFDVAGGYFWDQADIDGPPGVPPDACDMRGPARGLITDFDEMVCKLKKGIEYICPLNKHVDMPPWDKLSSIILEDQFLSYHQSRDNWQKPDGVDVFMIAGYGKSTITGIVEYKRKDHHEIQLMTGDGDGTVPVASALGVDAIQRYLADMLKLNAGHEPMLANSEIQAQVLGLLRTGPGIYGNSITRESRASPSRGVPGIYGNFTTREAAASPTRGAIMVSTFSSVRVLVLDSQGNHTGVLPDGTKEEGIPGSSFEEVENQQFVTVPEGDTYTVITEGFGNGDMTLWQTDIDPTGLPRRILEWDSVSIQPGSVNTLVTQFGAQSPQLLIDIDGDGVVDRKMAATNQFPGGGGPMLLADLNGDGRVDAADNAIVRASFGAGRGDANYNPVADVNRDGIVDQRDLDWVKPPPPLHPITEKLTITRRDFLPTGSSHGIGQFAQQLTVQNKTGSDIEGPVYLILTDLNPATQALVNKAGLTANVTPPDRPFVVLNIGDDNVFGAGQFAQPVFFKFTSPLQEKITYTIQAMAGKGLLP